MYRAGQIGVRSSATVLGTMDAMKKWIFYWGMYHWQGDSITSCVAIGVTVLTPLRYRIERNGPVEPRGMLLLLLRMVPLLLRN